MSIFGAFMLWVHTLSAFEETTGLPIPGSPWSYAVIVFALLNALILFFWVRSFRKYPPPRRHAEALSAGGRAYPIVSAVIGGIMFGGALLNLFDYLRASDSSLELAAVVFSFLCAFSMMTFMIGLSGGGRGARLKIVCILLFLCTWLLSTYKAFAADPILWHFAPRILSISASTLAFYYIAGIIYGHPRHLRALYFSLLGTFSCIFTLSDSLPVSQQIISLSLALMTLLLAFLLVNNMAPAAKPEPESAEDFEANEG